MALTKWPGKSTFHQLTSCVLLFFFLKEFLTPYNPVHVEKRPVGRPPRKRSLDPAGDQDSENRSTQASTQVNSQPSKTSMESPAPILKKINLILWNSSWWL